MQKSFFNLLHLTPRHAIILGLLMVGILGVIGVHPFLAINHPINAEMLVVEGWVPTSYMPLVVDEFRRGGYRRIVTVGVSPPTGQKEGDRANHADRTTQALIKLGLNNDLVTTVYTPSVSRHKTWGYVLAFQNWLFSSGYAIRSVNVFTLDAHARKSLLLFRRALGPAVQVGVISAKHQRYDPAYWWLSSTGIYVVGKNVVAYLDALLFTGNN